MPKLIIDNREIEVTAGTKVIDAAERLGIMIPRFCYHPALGSLGACRMCAVKFLAGPVKGVEMSCMVDARDGMVVSTTDPEAVEFRKYVIEWLMLHHPHDCPVCDEGGHCLLQDETVSGGHGLRRYLGKKRTFRDQDLGVLVQHEMNRCIHCWRCRRFYQEFAGYRDLGALGIGNRTYFGRFSDGPLESPFSGNLIDLCPTGVYTDKPARFKGRRWDFERAPSICLHCSLGCNTVGSARYREMIRQEARHHEAVNGYFICDRGRFGFYYANHPERPRQARIADRQVPLAEAVRAAAARMSQIIHSAGPRAVACWGSTRSSLETQGQLQRLCRNQGWPDPLFFTDPAMARRVTKAVARLEPHLAVSLREIENADFIAAVGADPLNEAPMLALAIRQACRKGATAVVLDPRPISLPGEFEHLPVAPGNLNLCLNILIKMSLGDSAGKGLLGEAAAQCYQSLPCEYHADPLLQDRLAALGQTLKHSQRPVLVCGTDITRETTVALAAGHAWLLRQAGKQAGLFYLLPGPNAFGAALLTAGGRRGRGTEDPASASNPLPPASFKEWGVLEAMEQGAVKALVVVESDLLRSFPDQPRLAQALARLELLVGLDYLPSLTVKQADIFLPTTPLFEGSGSCFINQEGRLQCAAAIHQGGRPISQLLERGHPPREFLNYLPGGEPRPAGVILAELAAALAGSEEKPMGDDLWAWLARENPVFARVPSVMAQPYGIRLLPEAGPWKVLTLEELGRTEGTPADHLELLLVDWTFGTEELSAYSPFIQQLEEPPRLLMHPGDAQRLGLSSGGRVTLRLPGGPLTVELATAANMAAGVMVLPRHRRLAWQKLPGGSVMVPVTSIERG